MTDDLVERLEQGGVYGEPRAAGMTSDLDEAATEALCLEAAARIRELEAAQSTPASVTVSEAARERVARAIANAREGGWPADTYAMLQQHYLTMADAALRAIAEGKD